MTHETIAAPDWRAQIARLDGAYSRQTVKGYTNSLKRFEAWCAEEGVAPLPATPELLAAFVDFEAQVIKPGTIRSALCAIGKVHRLARLPDPTADEEVKLALRRAYRRHGRRQRQVQGLTREIRDALLGACPDGTLQGLRDRALLLTAYDTLCRRSELVAIEVEHLTPAPGGGWHVLVPRAKNDPHGDGRVAHASPQAAQAIMGWLDAAGIRGGPVFRGIRNGTAKGVALDPSEVARIFKRLAKSAALSADVVAGLSGHSARVGAAQDLAMGNADTLTIMRAGGWKSVSTVARYVERAVVVRRTE